MNIYYIPFQDRFIIYRPLRQLAFLGNLALVHYLQSRLLQSRQTGRSAPDDEQIEQFLASIDFWEADPPSPEPWRPTEDHRPTTCVLLMTNACNLRCTYCYAFAGEGPSRQMTMGFARTAIDTVYENARRLYKDLFALTLHGGGEPSANWSVLTGAVDYALAKDLPCEITMATNGVFSREQRDFVTSHFSGVSLSFDGLRDVQNLQRPTAGGMGSFEAVMETIRVFDERSFPYQIRITTSPEHFSRLPESVEFLCRESRCRTIQIEPTYSGARGGHADPTAEQSAAFIAAFQDAFAVACELGCSLAYSGARPLVVTTSFCLAASNALVVTPEGTVVACFEVHDATHPLSKEFSVGHLSSEEPTLPNTTPRKHFPIVSIDDGIRAAVHIDQDRLAGFAANEESRRESCRDCFCYWHCAGDCATRRSASTTATSGRCHVNREITKDLLAWYIAANDGVWRGNI